MRAAFLATLVCVAGLALGANAYAGGALEQIDITGHAPSPIAGQFTAKLVGIKWDKRSLPARYSMNTTLNPIPNPLGPAFMTVAQAQTAIQASMNTWNGIPTSFAAMNVVGTTNNVGLRRFDFINEITFRTASNFGAIASSPSVSLIEDTTLSAGDDVDLDGDSDVSGAISVVSDVDGDGDNEFPAGFYKAGTILDNDVQFNTKTSNGLRFTTDDSQVDNNARSTDLMTIAVHELGHSIGLSHSMLNQKSSVDGTGATMFPFIDTTDRDSELAIRSLETDDVAYASYFYPEGTTTTGLPAIQPGDVRFSDTFGLIKGNVTHVGFAPAQPLAGANVSAVNAGTGGVTAGAYSGRTQLSFDPATGGLFLIDPAYDIPSGEYTLPVPRGNYDMTVEPVDGFPVPSGSVGLTVQIGDIFGQHAFVEEYLLNRTQTDRVEVSVKPGKTVTGIDLKPGSLRTIADYGTRNFVGFTNVTPGFYYALAIPASEIAAFNPGQPISVDGMQFDTFVTDASVVPVFAEAFLTTGRINADGTASPDLRAALAATYGYLGQTGFVAQDDDLAQHWFRYPRILGTVVREGAARGLYENLFLVLRVPTTQPYPGVSAQPPFIGLDGVPAGANDVPINNRSFSSSDGGVTFRPDSRFNFRFSLILH